LHRYQRDLLQRRPTSFSIRLPSPRRDLLDGGASGRRFGEILRVDSVHLRELVDIVEIHVGRYRVRELHTCFFQSVQKVPHSLPELRLDRPGIDTAIDTWDEPGFRGAE